MKKLRTPTNKTHPVTLFVDGMFLHAENDEDMKWLAEDAQAIQASYGFEPGSHFWFHGGQIVINGDAYDYAHGRLF